MLRVAAAASPSRIGHSACRAAFISCSRATVSLGAHAGSDRCGSRRFVLARTAATPSRSHIPADRSSARYRLNHSASIRRADYAVDRILMSATVMLQSTLTCPKCGHKVTETMPTNACQWLYDCASCGVTLRPNAGDCCVYCSFGDVPCPPIQAGDCCGSLS